MRWELNLCRVAPPLSSNQRLHHMAAHRIRVGLQDDVWKLLKHHKVPAMDEATIWLEWTPGVARKRDTDNLEPTRKACVDAIVAAGLLPDDTPEYVRRPENRILPVQRGLGRLVLVIENQFTRGAE